MEESLQDKVKKVLKEKVNPLLQTEGGGVELVGITNDNIVKVKLQGACGACPFAQYTLTGVVERLLKEDIPEIKSVEAV